MHKYKVSSGDLDCTFESEEELDFDAAAKHAILKDDPKELGTIIAVKWYGPKPKSGTRFSHTIRVLQAMGAVILSKGVAVSIRVTAGVVTMSESDLRDVISAIDEAKESIEFTDEPMPDGDMDTDAYIREQAKRGTIRVAAPYGGIAFDICLNRSPSTQESSGFSLVK